MIYMQWGFVRIHLRRGIYFERYIFAQRYTHALNLLIQIYWLSDICSVGQHWSLGWPLPNLLASKNCQAYFLEVSPQQVLLALVWESTFYVTLRKGTLAWCFVRWRSFSCSHCFLWLRGTAFGFRCYLFFGKSGASLFSIKRLAPSMLSILCGKMRSTINCWLREPCWSRMPNLRVT